MFVLKRKLRSSSTAHFLGNGYQGKCNNLHGHTYHYEIEIAGDELDKYGMLIDFGAIEKICSDWVQDNWDHATLFCTSQAKAKKFWEKMNWKYYMFPPSFINTTAENMSKFLAQQFYKKFTDRYSSIKSVTMRVWETEESVAEYKVKKQDK